MQFIIERTDFKTIIDIKTGYEQIKGNFYKVKPFYYDSKTHTIKTSREIWQNLCLKCDDKFVLITSLNPAHDILQDVERYQKMTDEQFKNDEEIKNKVNEIFNDIRNLKNFVDFNDPERIQKIERLQKELEQKRQEEKERREQEQREKEEKEEQLKLNKFKERLQAKKIYGSDLQEYIYPAVKNDCKIPLKTLGSLFALFYIVIDDDFKPMRYCMEKKRKMTYNMQEYLKNMLLSYKEKMEAA